LNRKASHIQDKGQKGRRGENASNRKVSKEIKDIDVVRTKQGVRTLAPTPVIKTIQMQPKIRVLLDEEIKARKSRA